MKSEITYMYRIQCTFFSPIIPSTYVGSAYIMKYPISKKTPNLSPTCQGKPFFLSPFFSKSKNKECSNPETAIKKGFF